MKSHFMEMLLLNRCFILFHFIFLSLFYVFLNKYGFRLLTKKTWQCWAFANKHGTFHGFVV